MDKQKEQNDASSSSTLTTRHETSYSLNALNLLDETQLASAEVLMKRLMQSKKGGIESVADGIAILMRAKDLQLPFSSCLEHIHVVNGKTGIDVNLIKSLLLRAGVNWKCTKDYTPQYQYTDGNTIYKETQLPDYCVKCRTSKEAIEATKDDVIGVYPVKWFTDLKGNIYNEQQVSDKCVVAINKNHAAKLVQEGKFPIIRIPAQPIDFVTEYELTRIQHINGERIERKVISHFSFIEAQNAGLVEKDNYAKYPRIMVSHRAFTIGARDIANDLLMGCMETTELYAANGMDIPNSSFEDTSFIDISE